MSKILITGGAGFIGYHLSKRLSGENNQVFIASKSIPDSRDKEFIALLALPNVKIIEADLTEEDAWNKMGSNYDYVYHLVGVNGFRQFIEIPHEVLRIGISTTLNVLEWLRNKNNNPNAKILFTSSNEVYVGAQESFGSLLFPTPENVPAVIPDTYNPRWSYGAQKLFCEQLFIHYAKAYNLRMVILRPHNVYGPKAGYQPMIPKMIERIENRVDPFLIISAGENRSSCYIDDLVDGMIMAIESPKTDGGTYNIGGAYETTVKKLVETMLDIAGWHPKSFDEKNSLNDGDKHCLPDISKLKRDTGWEPRTTLEEGLQKTIVWYMAHPKI